jgi:hypothetical protein
VGGAKSGPGGRALLAGLLSCSRCGRHLLVSYSGRAPGQPVYRCERSTRCSGFPGASRSATCGSSRGRSRTSPLRGADGDRGGVKAERRYMEARVNNSASWNWSCNRLDMKPRVRNGATLPVIPTIA